MVVSAALRWIRFRLNLVGKYLTYGFVALGLVLCWGDAGILSLGTRYFLRPRRLLRWRCILKLEASTPEEHKDSVHTRNSRTSWTGTRSPSLPWFWQPFHSLAFTLFMAIPLVPMLLAFVIGVAMFKRRVGGTYFAIITQAFAAILTILIIGQQGYTGGSTA